jgi:hypothetical protein
MKQTKQHLLEFSPGSKCTCEFHPKANGAFKTQNWHIHIYRVSLLLLRTTWPSTSLTNNKQVTIKPLDPHALVTIFEPCLYTDKGYNIKCINIQRVLNRLAGRFEEKRFWPMK